LATCRITRSAAKQLPFSRQPDRRAACSGFAAAREKPGKFDPEFHACYLHRALMTVKTRDSFSACAQDRINQNTKPPGYSAKVLFYLHRESKKGRD